MTLPSDKILLELIDKEKKAINGFLEKTEKLNSARLDVRVKTLNTIAEHINQCCQNLEKLENNDSGSDESNLKKAISETNSLIDKKFNDALNCLILEESKEISNQITDILSSYDQHRVNTLSTHIKTRESDIPAMLKAGSAIQGLFARINSSVAESQMIKLTESNKKTYEAIEKQVDEALNVELDAIQKQIETEDKALEQTLKSHSFLSNLHLSLIKWFDFATQYTSKLELLTFFPSQILRIEALKKNLLFSLNHIFIIHREICVNETDDLAAILSHIAENVTQKEILDKKSVTEFLEKRDKILTFLDFFSKQLNTFDLSNTTMRTPLNEANTRSLHIKEVNEKLSSIAYQLVKSLANTQTKKIDKLLNEFSSSQIGVEALDTRVTRQLRTAELLTKDLSVLSQCTSFDDLNEMYLMYCFKINQSVLLDRLSGNNPLTMVISRLESSNEAIERALKEGRESDAKGFLAEMKNIKNSGLRMTDSRAIIELLNATNHAHLNFNDEHNRIVRLYEKASRAVSASEAKSNNIADTTDGAVQGKTLDNALTEPSSNTGKLDEVVQGETLTHTTTSPSSTTDASENSAFAEKPAEINKRENSLRVFDEYVAELEKKKKAFSQGTAIYQGLDSLLQRFQDKKSQYINNSAYLRDTFKNDIKNAIEQSEPVLRTHRSTNPLLRAILAFLQQLGQVFNRHSVFATTDTMKKTRKVVDALNDLSESKENSPSDLHRNKAR